HADAIPGAQAKARETSRCPLDFGCQLGPRQPYVLMTNDQSLIASDAPCGGLQNIRDRRFHERFNRTFRITEHWSLPKTCLTGGLRRGGGLYAPVQSHT